MTTTEELISQVLQGIPVQVTRDHRIFITVPRTDLIKTVNILASELNVQHVITISARDTGVELELLYHFFVNGVVITIRTSCPRDDPTVESIVKIFPGAMLYEREVHDLLGIVAKGHPDLQPLLLPDTWEGGYPLRKDWKPAEGGED
jgi:NADH:ubiquinone oxidoreductase subunit C